MKNIARVTPVVVLLNKNRKFVRVEWAHRAQSYTIIIITSIFFTSLLITVPTNVLPLFFLHFSPNSSSFSLSPTILTQGLNDIEGCGLYQLIGQLLGVPSCMRVRIGATTERDSTLFFRRCCLFYLLFLLLHCPIDTLFNFTWVVCTQTWKMDGGGGFRVAEVDEKKIFVYFGMARARNAYLDVVAAEGGRI